MITKEKIEKTYNKQEININDYIGLVKNIASKFSYNLPPVVEYQDLVSAGMIGLLEASRSYDPQKNVKFDTYATYRIRGKILNHLESLSWIPRSAREKAKKLDEIVKKLYDELGRNPEDDEIMKELGLDENSYSELINDTLPLNMIPLDNLESINNLDVFDDSNPEELVDRELKINIVKEAIEKLSEKERLVITLYFYEDLNLKEIGHILDVGESRVCQILSTAMTKIRAYIKGRIE